MNNPNTTHIDISISDINDVQVDIRGDRIRLSSVSSPHSFGVYINMEDINVLIERIGKKMIEKSPRRIGVTRT